MGVASSVTNWASFGVVLLLLHLYLGGMIFTHGFRKAFRGGRIEGTARWFESIGMKPGKLNAYAASATEMGSGLLLTFGLLTSLACAALIALMLVAIVCVHRKNGFMITNPGGGVEYCTLIAIAALALGTLGAGRFSLDHVWGLFNNWTPTASFCVTLLIGFSGALLQLALLYRPRNGRQM